MACNSIIALPRVCAEGVVGGLEKVYIIAHKDLSANYGNEVFSATTAGVVSAVGLASGKTYVEIGLLKSTSGLQETLTKDQTAGISYFTQTFTLVVGDLSIENQTFVKSVKDQPVSILYKTRTGKYFVVGLNGQFEVSGIEGGTGTAEGDLVGHTLTFAGISTAPAPFLDDSLVATLIA